MKSFEKRSSKVMTTLSARLGDIARMFSLLEQEVAYLLSLLVNRADIQIGLIVAQRLSYSQVLALIDDIAEKTEDETARAKVKDLIARLREAGRLRNQAVHSVWGHLYSDDNIMIQLSRKGGTQKEQRHETRVLIRELARQSKQVFGLYDEVNRMASERWFRGLPNTPSQGMPRSARQP